MLGLGERVLPRGGDAGASSALRPAQIVAAAAKRQEPRVSRPGGRRHRIGENDDRRFEALGAVHGHHPHFVARDLHVALDFGARLAQPGEETLQRRRLAPLVIEREIEEFVERVVGFRAEPREETPPRAAGAENFRVKRERRLAPRVLRQRVEPRIGVGEYLRSQPPCA